MVRKLFLFIIVLVLAFSFCTTSFAYDYISSTSVSLYINASGKATCTASITAYTGTDSVRLSGYLQQLTGSGWVSIAHWTSTASGTYTSMSHDRYVDSGYSYKFKVYYYAFEGTDVESTSRTAYDSY